MLFNIHQIFLHVKPCKAPAFIIKIPIRFHYRSSKGLIFGQNIGFRWVFRRTDVVQHIK